MAHGEPVAGQEDAEIGKPAGQAGSRSRGYGSPYEERLKKHG